MLLQLHVYDIEPNLMACCSPQTWHKLISNLKVARDWKSRKYTTSGPQLLIASRQHAHGKYRNFHFTTGLDWLPLWMWVLIHLWVTWERGPFSWKEHFSTLGLGINSGKVNWGTLQIKIANYNQTCSDCSPLGNWLLYSIVV